MIHEALLAIASRAPLTSGLQQGDSFISYAAAAEQVQRLAAGLIERGIGQGDVVALLMPNSPDIFVASHALFAIGAIVMPLGLTATRTELTALAGKTGLSAVISSPTLHSTALNLIADVSPNALLVTTDRLADLAGAPITLPPPCPETVALYLFSSGSTGMPKIVPHTHGQILADGKRTSDAWDLQPDDIALDILPPNFAMGYLMGIIDVASRCATTFYWNDPLPFALSRKKLLDTIVHRGVTFMGAVPAMYEMLAAQHGAFDHRVRLAFSGGAALNRSVFEDVRDRLGITLRQSYGSTEAIMVSHNGSTDPDASWASVGTPAGDAKVKLEPVDAELGPDVGELLVQSSSLMDGYLDEPAANAEAFDDGWFRTGDLATLDNEGRIFIRGRTKLLIEVSGFKIDPIEVEDTLIAHPAIAESAVIGVPDGRSGNRLRAYVVRNHALSEDEVIRHLRSKLSVQKVPAEIAFIDELPKSPTGKILRGKLRDL